MKDTYRVALTIDVEDGINISMRDHFQVEMEPTGRVEENMEVILEICEKNNVKGTFFILGEVAKKFPALVKRISNGGHEVGVHGYHHDQIFKLTPEKLRSSLERSKDMMQNLTGKEILGFRAPAFSINSHTSWALHVIAACGFTYDSSIFPSLSLRYGWKDFTKDICRLDLGDSHYIIEAPLSVVNYLGRDIPVGGGGYLRYFPYYWTQKALQQISKKRSPIIYLHPYELDAARYPDYFHKAVASAPIKRRFMLSFYRLKKHTVRTKLDRITQEFDCLPMIDIIEELDKNQCIPTVNMEQ
jgi:polysaccharide deacetylase family protein (PEP-CTERM system associated)